MKKKILLLVLLVLIVPSLMIWAKGEQESAGGTGSMKSESFHFIIVNNLATMAHFNPDYEGAQLACEEIEAKTGDKVTFEIVGPAENDILKSAQAMEQAIAKRPDGFAVVCWDAEVMVTPIDKAMDAGIPVVTIDADAPNSKRLSYIGTDWYTLGIELGNALMDEIGGKGKVAMLGIVGADNMETAFDGFRSVVADYPQVEIVALEHDAGQDSIAAEKAAAILQAHPDLAGFAGFGVASGPGISVAVREANKVGKVKVVGNDLNTAQIKNLEDGVEQFVLGQKRVFFGYWGILMLYLHNVTSLSFTSNDEAAGISNIPPRVITGFLRATPDNIDLFKEAFEEWDKPKKWR
jgi:ABC-type sugar transport system substrate-binding protein